MFSRNIKVGFLWFGGRVEVLQDQQQHVCKPCILKRKLSEERLRTQLGVQGSTVSVQINVLLSLVEGPGLSGFIHVYTVKKKFIYVFLLKVRLPEYESSRYFSSEGILYLFCFS